jgi:hypothetical protein
MKRGSEDLNIEFAGEIDSDELFWGKWEMWVH